MKALSWKKLLSNWMTVWCLALGATLARAAEPRTATATVMFGFVVNIQINDPGAGYVQPPPVTFTGGGGTSAVAYAVLTNGSIASIIVTNAGSGYTSAPTVIISPPTRSTTLDLVRVPMLVVSGEPMSLAQLQYANRVDATNWTTITNVVLTSNAFFWADLTYPVPTNRFYRVNTTPSDIPILNPNPARLVWIHAGSFSMGSPSTEPSRGSDEVLHQVTLTRGFFMDKFELTQREYSAVIGSSQSIFASDPDLPVDNASWTQATNYCARFTALESGAGRLPVGWAYRLPTEAEWEYACRAGTTSTYAFGPSLSLANANFNPGAGAVSHTTKGGAYPANAWGLYDMHGNVWEWCLDNYAAYPAGSVTNPVGSIGPNSSNFRGGNWYFNANLCRSAQREYVFNSSWQGVSGFRIVLAPVQ